MRCCIASRRERRGVTCQSGMGTGRRYTADGCAGGTPGCGNKCGSDFRHRRTREARSSGKSISSTAPLCERTSTRQGQKSASPDEQLGRSRGGLTTKIHARVDGAGRLFTLLLTPGRQHDSTVAEQLMRQGAIHTCQRGRPAVRPKRVAADKAYGSRAFKAWLRRHGIRPTIPRKSNQRRGRPHNTERYKSATTLSASSVGSSTSEPLPHATTNAPPAFWRPSCSLPFLSFCDLQTHPSIGD